MGKPSIKLYKKKSKKIVFFQWFFLVFTGVIYYTFFGFKMPTLINTGTSNFILNTIILLAMLSSLGISICLFSYTRSNKRFIMAFAIIMALIWIFLAQFFYFNMFLASLNINISDIEKIIKMKNPHILIITQNDPSRIFVVLSFCGFVAGLFVYGLPLLLLYIFYKVIKNR